MHIHLILDNGHDAALIRWLESVPKGQRTPKIKEILRWYTVPGGFQELIAALQAAGPAIRTVEPLLPEIPQDSQDVLADAMADFGFG